jgi:hypothetical protein
MRTVISATKPVIGMRLEIVDSSNGKTILSNRVTKMVESQEHLNTFICVLANGEKVTVVYWKRLCD